MSAAIKHHGGPVTTIGLLGGMSWDSSATYYRIINEQARARLGGHHCAQVVMVSLDFAEVRDLQRRGDWDAAQVLLVDAAQRLEAAAADFVVLCTNYMHKLAPALQTALGIPLLHIADAVAAAAQERGLHTLELLGARAVMEESFYAARLGRWGMEVVVPDAEDGDLVDRVIFDELTQSRFEPASRAAYMAVIARLAARGAQAVVLGCTEIGLLLSERHNNLPLLDSAQLHALAAVDQNLTPAQCQDIPLQEVHACHDHQLRTHLER